MNTLVTIVLLCFSVTWFASFVLAYNSKWAFPLWFPITATSALGTLAWIAVIPNMFSGHGGGEAVGWAAFGAWTGFLYLLICPIVLAVSIGVRPKAPVSPSAILLTIIGYVLIVWGVASSARFVERVPVHITVTDSDGIAIAAATVSYETLTHGSGFSGSELKGEDRTSAMGTTTIFTQKTHDIIGSIRKTGFEDLHFHIDRNWAYGIHQAGVGWNTYPAGKMHAQEHSAGFDIPTGNELSMKVYLPRKNQETLPYPPYNPSWAPK